MATVVSIQMRSLVRRGAVTTLPLAPSSVRAFHQAQQRMAVRALAKEPSDPAGADSAASSTSGEPSDFWEGESWELFGKAASFALPLVVALAVGVGLFAAQSYNNGADVFLETPKSPEDTARLLTLD